MIAVEHVPTPAGAPAGSLYFHCARLSAKLSTQACASRWSAAQNASPCSGCAIGRQHHNGAAQNEAASPKQKDRLRECMRCGRTDLRVIQQHALCVSCFNRTAEWRAGRNAKGKAPAYFTPLSMFPVATESPAGEVVHHAIEARHAAEAVGVVALRRLAQGARLSPARPGETRWSDQHGRLVIACPACGRAGLLERATRGTLSHHCPGCAGAPSGQGWALAKARMVVMLIDVDGLKAWFEAFKEEFPHNRWSFAGFGCGHCRGAMLQTRGTGDGCVLVRCPACGEQSD
jgi:hypothetical protein